MSELDVKEAEERARGSLARHEPMGINAPQWCTQCSEALKMHLWVPWPCPEAAMAQSVLALADLARRLAIALEERHVGCAIIAEARKAGLLGDSDE